MSTVTFTETEWAMMMDDPARFGYACRAERHFFPNGYDDRYDFCPLCEAEMEEPETDFPSDFPEKTIKCGNCGDRHRTAFIVKACYGLLD